MKIAVLAGNGRVGRLLVQEAISRGHQVTSFGRGENRSSASEYVKKDLYQLTKEDLSGFDAVIDAAGGWDEKSIPNIPGVCKHAGELLKGSGIPFYVVGGAGSLFVNKEHTVTVDMDPSFPEAWKPLSANHGIALSYLRESKDLDWVYVSPAADFVADGPRTGKYILAGEEFQVNSKGVSSMSYADYAIGMIDLVESKKHLRERVSLLGE